MTSEAFSWKTAQTFTTTLSETMIGGPSQPWQATSGVAAAVLPAIRGLDDDRTRLYYDLVYNSLNAAARRALEAMMKGYEYQKK